MKLTAFAVVREREMGTIEALLVTPIRPIELMVAKMIPNLCVAVLNLALTFSLGLLIFGVPFRGSLLLFSILASLFAISGLGLGLAISSISQSQVQANQLATLMNVAGMFLSGFLFPVYGLPLVLRMLGYTMPMTFFMPIVTGVITKGVGLNDLWVPVLALTALTIAIFFVGAAAQAQVDAAKAQVAAAQAALDLVNVKISKLTVIAPSASVVLNRPLYVGEMADPGATVVELGALDRVTLTVYIHEDLYGQIKLGQKATVHVDSFPGKTFDGTVDYISDQAEFTPRNVQTVESRSTTVYAIKISIPNPDRQLKPGMPADASFLSN